MIQLFDDVSLFQPVDLILEHPYFLTSSYISQIVTNRFVDFDLNTVLCLFFDKYKPFSVEKVNPESPQTFSVSGPNNVINCVGV